MLRFAELFLFLSSASVGTVLAMEGPGWRIQSSIGWLLYTGGSPMVLGSGPQHPQPPCAGSTVSVGTVCCWSLCQFLSTFLPLGLYVPQGGTVPCAVAILLQLSLYDTTVTYTIDVVNKSCLFNVIKDWTSLASLLLFCSPATAHALSSF